MFQQILVPLDGSARAEEALPLAAHLAHRTGGTLFLFCAVPYAYATNAGALAVEIHDSLLQEAQAYLEQASQMDLLAHLPLRTGILSEPPVQGILSYAQSEHIDLIVMCSHGYTGLKRWALGSVAQKVARYSAVPVVILPEQEQPSPLYHPEVARPLRALAGLDGSSLAEAALLPTAQLVALASPPETLGELHLMRVIKPPSDPEERMYLKYDIDIREFNYREAEQYLRATKRSLAQHIPAGLQLQITSSIVEEADIATALIKKVETKSNAGTNTYDLMALATHGRSGLKRWMIGSVTERVLEEARFPLLIARAQVPAATTPSSAETPA